MKEKVLKSLFSVLYANIEYPLIGNKYLLAANKILYEVRIDDIDMIYDLAKYIEDNVKNNDINDEIFNNIYNKYQELIKKYLNKDE